MDFDVFNGDADGILSLVQLRLAEPRKAELVTGCKRDIALLSRVAAGEGDRVSVLDISMQANRLDLLRILEAGADVQYFDHHSVRKIPDHPKLKVNINNAPEMCTAALVDRNLNGRYRAWAVAAAYGDNFPSLAERLAKGLDLPLSQLRRLGEMVNYNSYGGTVVDLHINPSNLYRKLSGYETPMAFLAEQAEVIAKLEESYHADFALADGADVIFSNTQGEIRCLPDKAWSRRISGLYANRLTHAEPERAHAILTKQSGGYLVSIRSPIRSRTGADRLARQFETGGGRAAAAGINHLPAGEYRRFVEAFESAFQSV